MRAKTPRAAAVLLAVAASILGAPAQARQRDEPPAAASAAGSGPVTPAPTAKLDLNSATEQELATLPGIDAAKAQLIISNRPYDSTELLVQLRVLTHREFQAIKNQVTTAPAAGRR